MILVFPCLLVVIHHIVVDLPKTLDDRLLVARILSTSDLRVKLVHHLEAIAEIVLHSGCTGFVVEHVEHLAKIHRRAIWSTISHQPEHDAIRVVLQLDGLIHPDLP
uniref:AC5 n=1 Tax=Euphorbia yellow mosaic virus TaxID=598494 RepID=A0A7G5F2U4_9GEMI|nr:AC5 [Euphorbia yellow mosaic virus]